MKIHYIKDNDLPDSDDYTDKLLFVEDNTYNSGYKNEIGFYRNDANGFDNCEHGWVQGNVIAWCDIHPLYK